MEINSLLRYVEQELEKSSVTDAQIDAFLLLAHVTGLSRTEIYLHGRQTVSSEVIDQYKKLIARRCSREPYAYIVSEQEFFSLPFYVDTNVLIPRPETEFLLEHVLQVIAERKPAIMQCVDLCCGSGVIAVILAQRLRCNVMALDISEAALRVTRKNASRHNLSHRITVLRSDLFAAMEEGLRVPLIVSNPPYVCTDEIANELEPEVALYEPHLALDGGRDGLDIIRRIADALCHLTDDGLFFMEFGWQQGAQIQKIFAAEERGGYHYSTVKIYQDYAGKDRILGAEIKKG